MRLRWDYSIKFEIKVEKLQLHIDGKYYELSGVLS